MTTTQYDIQRSGILGRMTKFKAMADQYAALQQAEQQYQKEAAALAALDQEEQQHQEAMAARSRALIANMTISADPPVHGGRPLGGPVSVIITRTDGEYITKPLAGLETHERERLFSDFWNMVPACIRAMGNNPEAAYQKYVISKGRGYVRD